ncbi:MAG TPA: YCF48-related protein [Terriglobia bacterium]|nr:YCF48-related protein [Terriglobia bacterium]
MLQVIRKNMVVFFVSCILLCGSAAAQERHMQLLAPDTGWVLGANKLYWTTDNGSQWQDITPRMSLPNEKIADVYFKDGGNGWVLLSTRENDQVQIRFELASTTNPGSVSSWTVTPVGIPGLPLNSPQLTGGGQVYFVDSQHGWLNLGVESSVNFMATLLLATRDGGRAWNRQSVPGRHGTGIAGALRFVTPNEGWLAGGPAGKYLLVTRDGGQSWEQVSLKAPAETGTAAVATYNDPPIFQNAKRGFVAVTYTGPEEGSALVLFATSDGGRTWAPFKVLRGAQTSGDGGAMASTFADSIWLTATASEYTLSLTAVPLRGGDVTTLPAHVRERWPSVSELSFASRRVGWVWAGAVLATADGGATWEDISPWRSKHAAHAATQGGTPR